MYSVVTMGKLRPREGCHMLEQLDSHSNLVAKPGPNLEP